MIIDQSTPVTSWIHGNVLNKVKARLCDEHASSILSEYDTETAENKKLKVFMPKLVDKHQLGKCEVWGCDKNSNYIAYGLEYNINVKMR